LKTVKLSSEITYIGNSVFSSCIRLRDVELNEKLTYIGDYAFSGCNALSRLNVKALTPPVVRDNSFTEAAYYSVDLLIPESAAEAYMADPVWTKFLEEKPVVQDSQIEYVLNDDGQSYSVRNMVGDLKGRLVIPAEHEGLPVTKILSSSFSYCNLTELELPNTITHIEDYTFSGCLFECVDIPSSVVEIGSNCFSDNRRLKEVNFGNSLVVLGLGAFSNTSIDKVSLPESLKKIDACVFQSTELSSIYIPASVSEIGSYAFSGSKLKEINVDVNNKDYCSVDGVLYSKNMTKLCSFPAGRSGEYVIDGAVKEIGNSAFYGAVGLTGIVMPESLVSIGENSFFDTSLKSVIIPESVTSIASGAFSKCLQLTEIKLPSTLERLDENLFNNCPKLKEVCIPNTVNYLGRYVFSGCKSLTEIDLGALNITEIPESAFNGCNNLTKIVIPQTVRFIGESAFSYNSALKNIQIGPNVYYIGNWAFTGCSGLESIMCMGTTPADIVFDFSFDEQTYNNVPLYVPVSAAEAYSQSDLWSRFVNRISFEPDPASVSLKFDNIALYKGGSAQIADITLPQNIPFVNWKSSDTEVAIVDDEGMVTAVGVGFAEISFSIFGGEEYTCGVTVSEIEHEIAGLNGIGMEQSNFDISSPNDFTIAYEVFTDNTLTYDITWSSSDESIATVNTNGVVTPKANGTAIITARLTPIAASRGVVINPDGSIELNAQINVDCPGFASGLEDLIETTSYTVYNIQGVLVAENVGMDYIRNGLPHGIYILVSGAKRMKIRI